MKLKALGVLAVAGIIGFGGVAQAENEATYNANTGSVHIPKVLVDSIYFQVDMQQGDGLNFSVTTATPTSGSDSIVGSWGSGYFSQGTQNQGEAEYMSLTFYSNGSYVHYESGQQIEPCDNGGGVEYGTYTYNATTGTLATSSIVDENGCVGLTENGAPGSSIISITNDQLIFSDDGIIFDRVQ
jgi:hypothetical protein